MRKKVGLVVLLEIALYAFYFSGFTSETLEAIYLKQSLNRHLYLVDGDRMWQSWNYAIALPGWVYGAPMEPRDTSWGAKADGYGYVQQCAQLWFEGRMIPRDIGGTPGLTIFLWLLFRLFGYSPYVFAAVPLVAGIAGIVLTTALARLFLDENEAVLAGTLFAIHPALLDYRFGFSPEALAVALGLSTTYLFWRGVARGRFPLALPFVAFLTTFTRYEYYLLMPALVAGGLLANRRLILQRRFLALAGVFVFLAAAWHAFSWLHWHQVFFPYEIGGQTRAKSFGLYLVWLRGTIQVFAYASTGTALALAAVGLARQARTHLPYVVFVGLILAGWPLFWTMIGVDTRGRYHLLPLSLLLPFAADACLAAWRWAGAKGGRRGIAWRIALATVAVVLAAGWLAQGYAVTHSGAFLNRFAWRKGFALLTGKAWPW